MVKENFTESGTRAEAQRVEDLEVKLKCIREGWRPGRVPEPKRKVAMLPKYTIEYTTRLGRHAMPNHFSTDDPVACEEFVEDLMEARCPIRAIRHEGMDLPRPEFDRVIKTAASMLASRHICASLGIKPEEEHFRFGFSA